MKTPAPSSAWMQVFQGFGKPFLRKSMPLPARINSREVLVRIDLATICGSDLHTVEGKRTEPTPCILGHEAVGTVLELGPGRENVRCGDRISWSIADSCGLCPACVKYDLPQKCRELFKYGHGALSDGSGWNGCFATHILLRAGTHVVRIPDGLPNEIAAPANCALATMVNAVEQIPLTCRSALVQGAGMLGLYGCALLKARGVETVFCADILAARLQIAEAFGAIPLNTRPDAGTNCRNQVRTCAPEGVDAVLEVAGVSSLISAGVELLRPGGHYGFIGMVHPDSRLPVTGEQIIRKCLTIVGTHNYHPRHLDEALLFLERNQRRYPFAAVVEGPFPLSRLSEAFEAARAQARPRVSVAPHLE